MTIPTNPDLGDFNLGFNNILSSNANASNLMDMSNWSQVWNPYGQSGMAPNGANAGIGGWFDNGLGGAMKKMWSGLGSEGFQSGLSGFSNLANIYAGFKALGLMKDQLSFAKSSFNKNFRAQAQTYNNELRNDWEAKRNAYASRGQDYASMDEWMGPRKIIA